MNKQDRNEEKLRQELNDPQLVKTHPFARPLLWSIVGCIVVFFSWAAFAEIDEVTRGEGRVVPVSRLQKIQSLEGGILGGLLVKEGDMVEVGQPLVQIDRTRFRTSLDESINQTLGLKAAIARLQAEVLNQGKIDFPDDVIQNSSLVRSETALFKSRRDKLTLSTSALTQQIHIAEDQLRILNPLVARKVVSEMDSLKLKQDIANLKGRLAEIRSSYSQDAYTELSAKRAELSALEPIVQQRDDQLRRTEIVSPVRGRVNTILVNTRGGVVQPGEPIMEVIPVEDRLLIEARITPRDVAFLIPGMPAKVKITAYDYTVYGDLVGTLEQISADTIQEDTVRGKESYYQVLIRTERAELVRHGKNLPIIPGMVAEVDILNGKRTVLNYLLRPIMRASLR